jgi:hypothetical protein
MQKKWSLLEQNVWQDWDLQSELVNTDILSQVLSNHTGYPDIHITLTFKYFYPLLGQYYPST